MPLPFPHRGLWAVWVSLVLTLLTGCNNHGWPVEPSQAGPEIVAVRYLEDAAGHLQLEDVMQADAPWVEAKHPSLSLGYSSSAFFLHLRIRPNGHSQAVLTLLPSFLDDVQFYVPEAMMETATGAQSNRSDGHQRLQQGDQHPPDQQSYDWRSANVRLHFPGPAPQDIYIRVQTTSSLLLVPQIWGLSQFEQFTHWEMLVFGIIAGGTLAYIGLSLILMFQGRRIVFLYVFYATTCLFWYVLVNGLAPYVWPQLPPYLYTDLLNGTVCILLGTGTLFVKALVHTAQNFPKLDRLLNGSVALQLMLALPSFLGAHAHYVKYLVLLNSIQWLLIAIICAQQVWAYRGTRRYAYFTYFLIIASNTLLLFTLNASLIQASVTIYMFQILTFVDLTFLLPLILHQVEDIQAEKQQSEIASSVAHAKLELEQRARQEQRQWLAMITHDIKTPLTVIDASRQSIEALSLAPDIRQRTDKIARATHRIDQLVAGLLKEEELSSRSVYFSPLTIQAREWVALLWDALKAEGLERVHLDPIELGNHDTELYQVDLDLLEMALRNLIGNGLQHGDESGMVRVQARCLVRDHQPGLSLEVYSQGPPMPAAIEAGLFQRHFTHGPRSGSGLGLWATLEIALKHGGHAWHEPQGESGHAFLIWLPRKTN